MKSFVGKGIAEVSKKDKPWNKHKCENSLVGGLYGESIEYRQYADRMAECADWLEFAETAEHDKKLKLTRAAFCHVRHCPICQWRKALARNARFMNNLPDYLRQYPDFAYLYLVLTSRNCPMENLRETIQAQNDAVKKLLKRLGRAGVAVHGYIRTNEVTKGKDSFPHPHINLVLAVNKSYFTGRAYLKKEAWIGLWRECMKLDYDPSVFVSRVRRRKKKDSDSGAGSSDADDLISGVLEVSKYSIKPEDMVDDAEFLYGITAQCHKLRFLSTGGCLKDIFKKDGADEEDIGTEEMLLKTEDDAAITGMRQLYLWYGKKGYILKLRRQVKSNDDLAELEFREGLTRALRERSEERRKSS